MQKCPIDKLRREKYPWKRTMLLWSLFRRHKIGTTDQLKKHLLRNRSFIVQSHFQSKRSDRKLFKLTKIDAIIKPNPTKIFIGSYLGLRQCPNKRKHRNISKLTHKIQHIFYDVQWSKHFCSESNNKWHYGVQWGVRWVFTIGKSQCDKLWRFFQAYWIN
jgi:hypothetical protein